MPDKPNTKTRQVMVGNVAVGGGAPVSVQSMCTTDTHNADATLAQIRSLADEGCELVRVAVPVASALDGFERICAESPIPVISDIHFDHELAIESFKCGAKAVRINPGNIGSFQAVDAVIDAAGEAGVPIRIGVNAGSLDKEVDAMEGMSLPEKLVASSVSFVEHFEARGFKDIVVSAKAHDVPTTIETYTMLSKELPEIPLHIGVTEAGTFLQGTVKSSVGLGYLLSQGIGDTMRVSLTADPVEEIKVGWEILASLGIRRRKPELISCPTCGRCQVNLIDIATEVEKALANSTAPISVAVMGCVVNGPGEASGADIGVACGKGKAALFVNGETIRTVSEDEIVPELLAEINSRWG